MVGRKVVLLVKQGISPVALSLGWERVGRTKPWCSCEYNMCGIASPTKLATDLDLSIF
jgi:hypothetical protein